MSDASNRIQKFSDDVNSLLAILFPVEKTSQLKSDSGILLRIIPKLTSEINKLRVWLQKHQNESVADGFKNKLFLLVDLFYRFYINNLKALSVSDLLNLKNTIYSYYETLFNLMSDYLQLPEGKLVSAKDKKKVMTWSGNLIEIKNPQKSNLNAKSNNETINSFWILQDINKDNTLSLLNKENSELWKENFRIKDKELIISIKNLFETCQEGNSKSLIIKINESSDEVVETTLEADDELQDLI